jgi:chromosome segregation ATPase
MSLESVRREKEMLEKNFKELVVKINQNDTVIGQLKEKIEVLGQQNVQLSQQNEELAQTNTVLSQDNATLSKSNVELTQRNAALTQHNEQLSAQNTQLAQQAHSLEGEKTSLEGRVTQLNQEKQTLAKDNEKLSQDHQLLSDEHSHLQNQAQTWKNEAAALSEENQQLRSQSAALLAARIVQEHNQKQAAARAALQDQKQTENSPVSRELRKPAAPVLHSLGRKIATSTQAEEEWELISTRVTVPSDKHTAVQTTENLPEIKVAEPTATDELFDGEDFLEKTDSFIGRMKWSIFRENR